MPLSILFRAYLKNQLKFSTDAKADALFEEGIEDWDSFLDFHTDSTANLCKTIRSPGGQTVAADGTITRNNGIMISTVAEQRLSWAVYAAHYYSIVGRPIDAVVMSWGHIKHFNHLKDISDNHTAPDQLPSPSRHLNIMKWLELLDEHLASVLGICKVPLSYVI